MCARLSISGEHPAVARDALSALKRWAVEVAKRRGLKRAKVALARKIGVILHRMWSTGRISMDESGVGLGVAAH